MLGQRERSFTLLAGTMPCWPCREQRHQPSSPRAFPLQHRRASLGGRTSSCEDSSCVVVQCPGQLGLVVRWEQGEGSSHTSSGHITPAQNTELPGFPQAEHITSIQLFLMSRPGFSAIPCILTLSIL